MARLNTTIVHEDTGVADDALPDLNEILGNLHLEDQPLNSEQSSVNVENVREKRLTGEKGSRDEIYHETSSDGSGVKPQNTSAPQKCRQLSSLSAESLNARSLPELPTNDAETKFKNWQSPRRAGKAAPSYKMFVAPTLNFEGVSSSEEKEEDTDEDTDLSGFIVSDSVDEEELVSRPRVRKRLFRRNIIADDEDEDDGDSSKQQKTQSADDGSMGLPSVLTFTPPRKVSPIKLMSIPATTTRTTTPPPSSPTKPSVLQSPTKKIRIPATPHRASIDAFWNQEVINDWNEQYSPKKTPRTRRRLYGNDDTEMGRVALKSPTKHERNARKVFESTKHELATSFLAELDAIITNGQVGQMTAATGGAKIVWSGKLSSTAGRASWRRERIGIKTTDSDQAYKHTATIELSSKVIGGDTNRLLNTIAHEFCHLANFIVSGIRNNPHGKEFKVWAAKTTRAFGKSKGINVTTKHTYEIAYKYIWTCAGTVDPALLSKSSDKISDDDDDDDEEEEVGGCGAMYKRHSKSIDPSKQACGRCKGRLIQILPKPLGGNAKTGDSPAKRPNEYQLFVKRGFERVRRENPGLGWGGWMAVLGKEFREMKRLRSLNEGADGESGCQGQGGGVEIKDEGELDESEGSKKDDLQWDDEWKSLTIS